VLGQLDHLLILVLRENALKPSLPLQQRQGAKILVTKPQEIEGEEDKAGRLACLHRCLKVREICYAVLTKQTSPSMMQLSNPRAMRASSGKVEL
jgi:hypothetical protein